MMTLHRLALITVGVTFLLLIIGGLVHATGSGLACGNVWPACGTAEFPNHGTWFPAMTGGVQFEHTHRIVAGLVGLLTLALAVWTWVPRRGTSAERAPRPLVLRIAAIAAVVLVFFQAMLGRKTVIEGLPDWVSASHLATAMAFFCLMIWFALRTRPGWTPTRNSVFSTSLRALTALTALAVYMQIVLGAAVRHMDAGLTCMTFPLCDGSAAGFTTLQHWHMAHRWGALVVALLVVVTMTWLLRRATEHPVIDATARAAIVLVAVQVLLGIASVFTELTPWIVTAHLALGTILLALTAALAMRANRGPLLAPRPHPTRPVEVGA